MLRIGALTRQSEAERSPEIKKHAPLFAKAIPFVAHPAIRNRGTIGGSIALADPAAELPACLLALEGEVEIAGPKGRRTVKADLFFKDLYETALGTSDVLTAIHLPVAEKVTRTGFDELARRHGDYAMVGLAANRQDGKDIRLVFFGVGSTPIRAKTAEIAFPNGVEQAISALNGDLIRPTTSIRVVRSKNISRKHFFVALPRNSPHECDP